MKAKERSKPVAECTKPAYGFNAVAARTVKAPAPVARMMWPHQVQMHNACLEVIKAETGRIRIYCATGGGKTYVECQTLRDGFEKYDFQIQVCVAPTIALLSQHDMEFYGIYMQDSAWCTGSDNAIAFAGSGSDLSEHGFTGFAYVKGFSASEQRVRGGEVLVHP